MRWGSSLERGQTYGALNDVVRTNFSPRDVSRIPLAKDSDRFALNDQLAVFSFDGALESAVGRIILEHVGLVRGD